MARAETGAISEIEIERSDLWILEFASCDWESEGVKTNEDTVFLARGIKNCGKENGNCSSAFHTAFYTRGKWVFRFGRGFELSSNLFQLFNILILTTKTN